MILSKKTTVQVNDNEANIINHMGNAAYKLWNTCNYERKTYNKDSSLPYPDWYYQKSAHKDDIWFKSLPSQTAQEVCKQLDKSWKSFFKLKVTGGIENPRPPRFKHEPMAIRYMQNGISRISGTKLRLTLPKALKAHMQQKYGICDSYLFIENDIFNDAKNIKQLHLYMPENGTMEIIVIYEIDDVEMLPGNGRYLGIDLGFHNLMTCYDNHAQETFIVGRKYLSIERYFQKEIGHVQEQWYHQQSLQGIEYPKSSRHIRSLYIKKNNSISDYLHKCTRYIANYCNEHQIHTVVIGDWTNIRQDNNKGHKFNQKMHSLPYANIYQMLEYKLALYGITLIKVPEAYTSQCSPNSAAVDKTHGKKSNRICRGLYKEDASIWNADSVGAYNILRKYLASIGSEERMSIQALSAAKTIHVAV